MAKRRFRYSHRFHATYVLASDMGTVEIEAVRIEPGPRAKRARYHWRLTVDGTDHGTFPTFREAESHIPPEHIEAHR